MEFTVTAGDIPEGCVRGVLGLPLSPEMGPITWLRWPEAVIIIYSWASTASHVQGQLQAASVHLVLFLLTRLRGGCTGYPWSKSNE